MLFGENSNQKGYGHLEKLIPSMTLSALEREIGEGGTDSQTSRDILVIDEAGMVGSRKMHELLSLAEKSHAKIVLVGDKRQLPVIEAGAALRLFQENLGYSELSGIRRQESERDRLSVRDLAVGHAEEALENLARRDRVHDYDSGRNTKERSPWPWSRHGRKPGTSTNGPGFMPGKKVFLAPEGIWRKTSHGEREFAKGDRILFTRNDRKRDLMNGDFGTVRGTLNGSLRIELDRGGMKEIDPLFYSHLEYGYAATCHKLQGATVDRLPCERIGERHGRAGMGLCGAEPRPRSLSYPRGDSNPPGIGPPMGPVPGKGHDPRLRRRIHP